MARSSRALTSTSILSVLIRDAGRQESVVAHTPVFGVANALVQAGMND